MTKRGIAVGALCSWLMCAWLMVAPTQSHAQVAEVILKCTRSLKVAVACVVLDQGVAKVVDISLDKLIELAFGRKKKLEPEDIRPTEAKLADVEASGIEWSKLQEFLISVFKAGTPVDKTQVNEKIAASCRANYQPICRHLGIPEPRQIVDCTKITTKDACGALFACSWKGSSCGKNGGTKELLGR